MSRRAREGKRLQFLSFTVIAAILVTLLSIFFIKIDDNSAAKSRNQTSLAENSNQKQPKALSYWGVCVKRWNPNGSLRTMNRIFRKLGYKFVNASNGDNWDILWSIEYPFKSKIRLQTELFKPMEKFKPAMNQRINHFPGIPYITNKGTLGTYTRSKFLLPSFIFPNDEERFNEYSAAHPDAKYVEKNHDNRGVRVVTVDKEKKEKLYQVFLDNPFLIDGHVFDFGVYVLISSVNPLRIYRYDHEVFIRFCPKKYHPFDSSDTQKYVIADDHMSVYDMPSFKDIYAQFGFTFKLIFENLIKNTGLSVEKFWSRVDDAIGSIVLQNERRIIEKVSWFKRHYKFIISLILSR
jgi:tubulin monoglycylase TTLL15